MITTTLAVVNSKRVLYVGEAMPEGTPAKVAEGIVRRRLVVLTGVCPCGARYSLPARANRRAAARRGELLAAAITHEHDCPAVCDELAAHLTAAE